ncbi:MAG TPA: pilus assembly PilX N-terminal domain-containing protein [Syntrophales bacterium]|nr:pilus assembly PilX N-terminal domain-containing protein [Syntrophales bacterium]HOX94293.1 pilus assembly PilX N-terminal domain-containing protein [Syntrophales bacterium]HPI58401.1 pilus assembly PilX N-terminal domain-containing protein [Syntrophales bacterium]HPN26075.1 pilus assembly PilX N-terminal domain-containing protein [Syntrophales bacterium]HQM30412.1 pilus assembly PilX N-terminal domain-containing protein [Syntrophales bacterium]
MSSQRGIALVVALLANVILLAVGVLAIHLSTRDIRVSFAVIGDKKAFAACESGIHALARNFDPGTLAAQAQTNVVVNAATDPGSRYTIFQPTTPTTGPAIIPITGYSIGGGQQWGQERFIARVRGENTSYNSQVEVALGLGFGPIEMSTMSR